MPEAQNSKLEGIELIDRDFGLAQTKNNLWRTSNNGGAWQEITPPKSAEQIVSAVDFLNERHGTVILSDAKNARLEIARTENGGESWAKQSLTFPNETLAEANLDKFTLKFINAQTGWIVARLASSSNFTRAAVLRTDDGGSFWQLEQNFMERGEFPLEQLINSSLSEKQAAIARINGKEFEFLSQSPIEISFDAPLASDENVIAVDFSNEQRGWILAESGRCKSFKSDCEQSARLLATTDAGRNWRDATPEAAKAPVKIPNLVSAGNHLAPGGATRISMNRGFDKCTAAPASQMQTWWNESHFYDSNIYIAGRNRGCSQPQLTAAWVDQVSSMGWGLIPTVVGYQAPCSVSTNSVKHSLDPVIAEMQGREEADIAILAANNLGLTQGTVLYYDMERYDNPVGTTECGTSVKGFLKGWTDRVKERGYISGVYGSPTNAVGDWINIPAASRMDAI
ncbi:MAG TPA: glycoside hydrolase domain-containing protein [Pyrinomonadaceae bacterium]|nr:glycoside hydrolase domain-containing protein [Pyrinomonadaceae bacterium]